MNEATSQEVKPVLVSKKEACRMLGGICVRTLENLIENKKLPVRYIGSRALIPYASLINYARR